MKLLILGLFVFLIVPGFLSGQVPSPAHVVIIIEENHNYTQIIGSSAAPYINSLVADSNAALFTQSYALTHPSQPNYIMLFSGSNQGVVDDNLPANLPFTAVNFGASLIGAGKSFAGYSEDLPYAGFTGTSSGAYARKHNPWVNWQASPTNGISPTANLPLTSFPVTYDSLPKVSFVVPNQNNDMHNGSDPATITTGDTWFRIHLDGYIQWAKTNNSLLILTFDEGTTSGNNRIVTLFIGSMVRHGQYNETLTHYSILRTLEGMFGLPHVGGTVTASPITDCWLSTAVVPGGKGVLPSTSRLEQNYPNPFNPATTIGFSLSHPGFVSLKVYNVLGREVETLVHEQMNAGIYEKKLVGGNLSSGVYYYRLISGDYSATKRLMLLK